MARLLRPVTPHTESKRPLSFLTHQSNKQQFILVLKLTPAKLKVSSPGRKDQRQERRSRRVEDPKLALVTTSKAALAAKMWLAAVAAVTTTSNMKPRLPRHQPCHRRDSRPFRRLCQTRCSMLFLAPDSACLRLRPPLMLIQPTRHKQQSQSREVRQCFHRS